MLPVSEANVLGEKNPDFGVTSAIKKQRRLCKTLGRAVLVAMGGGVLHVQ